MTDTSPSARASAQDTDLSGACTSGGRAPSAPREVRRAPPRPLYDALTSAYQRSVAAIGLIFLSPLLLVIALAVKLTSRGPVLYRGARVGRGKSTFTIYKFRTMRVGAEQAIGKRLVQPGEQTHYTPIGPKLRTYRLDELPQLINVLRGEMALVGPRPLRPIFLEELCERLPRYEERFDVRPGITGLAQVRGGYYTDPRNKLSYDLLYIKRRGFWLDHRLIALTFVRVMTKVISVGLALMWLLLAGLALPEGELERFMVSVGGHKLNLLYLGLPVLVMFKLLSQSLSRKRLSMLKTPVDLLSLLWLSSMAVSALMSASPMLALRGEVWYACNALIPFYLCANASQFRRAPHAITRRFAWLGALLALIALSTGLIKGLASGEWRRLGGALQDPLWLSSALVLLAPLAWVSYAHFKESTQAAHMEPSAAQSSSPPNAALEPWLSLSCALLISVTLLAAGSRLALFIVFAMALVSLKRGALLSVLGAVGLSVGLLSASGDVRFTPSHLTTEVSRHLERQRLVFEALPSDKLLFGVGARLSEQHLAERYRQELQAQARSQAPRQAMPQSKPRPLHRAHNLSGLLLVSLVEFGLMGGVLLLLILGRGLALISREAIAQESSTLKALSLSLFGLCGMGLISHPFTLFPITLLFWSLLGFGVGVALEGRRGGKRVYQVISASAPL